ncbi:MAG: nitroreductase family protein [PVC group bacterium]|nr:nitroreductase family protein [PVC group bacterium]
MELYEAICKRTSVRKYKQEAVNKDILEKLVDAGRRAPSARAVEPWEFVIVNEKTVLEKLSAVAPNGSFMKDAAAVIAIFSHQTKYYLEDGCAAIQNILLAVADVGLGACWVAGDKKDYVVEVGNMLGVPQEIKLVGLIALGWPAEDKKQAKNRSLEDVIHWETFGNKK